MQSKSRREGGNSAEMLIDERCPGTIAGISAYLKMGGIKSGVFQWGKDAVNAVDGFVAGQVHGGKGGEMLNVE
jgi:hypothetical protein